ncbi:type 1 glutamine amidotransferase [Lacticaseibacillus zhaodongensis]|uniref:type 1 glutamine amidotransferase n=1 Tax=Lacticaseibacillus zhaodongensis TaxID=2668065 RepID=UPI0012D2E2ED|nr:type 1 glutamine amidotransferase [Lacticaseibacillus zhaodongensis]
MRINILQHATDEGPGYILNWAAARKDEVYIYHPAEFGALPTAAVTDMLVLLGGPMSPNDDLPWIAAERKLIAELLAAGKPIFGACFGAQQITKLLGYPVTKAPAKEVGWAPVTLQSDIIPGLPERLQVLHWHEEMFQIPTDAELLFSSAAVNNQGFVYSKHVLGLQFHIEATPNNVREMAVNDFAYTAGSVLGQSAAEIIAESVPEENKRVTFKLFDYITEN